ncbi:MAG TPA: DUF1772 domain-containing protein [Pseudonocardiaceae bacterium]|nr:DUF1772 domain-containing protein [Pseudonocardiaceae bacterium]
MAVSTVLRVLAVLGSGVTAGVLFAVALSVLPALIAMPPERYVYTHRMIGRNWDPAMPIIVLSSVALDVAVAVTSRPGTATMLATIAAVLLFAVSAVSHLCNVPINKRVKALTDGRIPAHWQDPRPLWRRWHLLRTGLALAALVVNGVLATVT